MNTTRHYFLVSAAVEWKDAEDKLHPDVMFTATVPMKEVPLLGVKTIEKLQDYMCEAFCDAYSLDPKKIKGINALITSISYLGEMTKAQFLGKEEVEPEVKMN